MKKIPEVVFVVDGAFELQALREANSLKLESVGILNTNGNPNLVKNFIPANTNSVKSLDFIADEFKSFLSNIKVTKKVPTKFTDKKAVKRSSVKKMEETTK